MANLALLGGSKSVSLPYVGKNGIESFVPHVNQQGRDKINELLDKGLISEAPIVREFEQNFKNYVGAKHALCQTSGTTCIFAGLFGLGIGSGDEVLVPSFTFFASSTPVLMLDAVPVFCDVNPDTHCIDPKDIERKITPKTKAIVVVHVWGNPADMDAIMAIAKKHNLKVLEDCSHAHGAEYKGKKVGTIGDVGAFSLQGSKVLYGGEAGIMVTNDVDVYSRACALGSYERLYKYTGATSDIPDDNAYIQYRETAMGLKLRVHPIAIAIANSELPRLDERNEIRNTNAEYFDSKIADIPFLSQVKVLDGCKRVFGYHYARYDHELFSEIRLQTILKALAAEGVYCGGCGYGNLHREPAFAKGDILKKWANSSRLYAEKNYANGYVELPVTEYLRDTAFMAAPRFEDPKCFALIDQMSAAYHKIAENPDELRAYEKDHQEELDQLKPKSGRSINVIR